MFLRKKIKNKKNEARITGVRRMDGRQETKG